MNANEERMDDLSVSPGRSDSPGGGGGHSDSFQDPLVCFQTYFIIFSIYIFRIPESNLVQMTKSKKIRVITNEVVTIQSTLEMYLTQDIM